MTVDRDDLPGLLMTGAVAAGLAWYFVQPERVATVIGVSTGIGHPTLVLTAWSVALGILVVGTIGWWWGPVRVSRAEARWHMSGPDDHGPVLGAHWRHASVATLIGCLVTGTVVSTLDWSSAPVLLGVAAICAATILVVTTRRQQTLSAALTGRRTHGRSRWTVRDLHRDVFAPDDGLVAAARLAASTMDLGWLATARVVRWERGNTSRRSRRLPMGRFRACLAVEVVRLRRRPGDLVIWTATVAVGLAVPATLYLTSIAPAVATIVAYRAGSALAGGLRRITEEPALRRILGGSRAELIMVHSVVPIVGVVMWSVVTAFAWHLSVTASVVVTVGAAVATIRRATRPDLPFDAPVYVTGQGGVTQPLLLFAMLRGPTAVVITGMVATLIG